MAIRGFDKFAKELIKKLEAFTLSKVEMKKAGATVAREIKADGRNGKGYDGRPFPPIKESTEERREVLQDYNPTHGDYSAPKSNATFMGDTLDSISFKIKINKKKGKIILSGKGRHTLMRGPRGTLSGSNAEISDILAGLTKKGWRILGASKRSKIKIKKQFIRFLRRKL